MSEQQHAELHSSGLKCDNPNCDWKDETITLEDFENWLNVPCPKCGSNLLTEQDVNNVKVMLLSLEVINSLSIEELKEISGEDYVEKIKSNPVFKDAKGIDKITEKDEMISITFETHNQIKAVEIKNVNDQ